MTTNKFIMLINHFLDEEKKKNLMDHCLILFSKHIKREIDENEELDELNKQIEEMKEKLKKKSEESEEYEREIEEYEKILKNLLKCEEFIKM